MRAVSPSADPRPGAELVTAVGALLGAQVGSRCGCGLPATEQGIRRYLGSGLIKGIGPVMATQMVDHFGVDIMHVIDDAPRPG
jgi:exodeoxyribonuclease V alpha subunit